MPRLVLRLLTALVAAPLAYVAAGFAGAVIPGNHAQIEGARTERIGLARGPIHYDLLLPMTADTRADFGFAAGQGLEIANPRAEWLVVGWGAKEFYTTVGTFADLSAGAVFRAVSGDDAVLRLDLAGHIEDVAAVQWLDASPAQIAALRKISLQALGRDSAGQPIAIAQPNWGQGHLFYAANGRFHLGHTCNAWVGETLRAAGFALGEWTPTPQSLSLSLHWFAE
jgi:uncharacterized protein (TIGR02117 family)